MQYSDRKGDKMTTEAECKHQMRHKMTESTGLNCQRCRKRLQTEQDDFVGSLDCIQSTPVAFVARVSRAESQMGSAVDFEPNDESDT